MYNFGKRPFDPPSRKSINQPTLFLIVTIMSHNDELSYVDDELSWLFTKTFRAFYLISRK